MVGIKSTMIAISETYDRGHNLLELVDILPNVSFAKSETESGDF